MNGLTRCKVWPVILLLLSSLISCSTRTKSTAQFNPPHNQTPEFTLSEYRSPELRSKNQKNDLSVLVTISGGGYRAGNFGVGVLMALENVNWNGTSANLLKEVDYFSTVSGGGLAAGAYISSLHDHLAENDYNSFSLNRVIEDEQTLVRRNLERGYHNTLFKALANIRSMGMRDRGDFLERQFDWKILGARKRGESLLFKDMFIPADATTIPVTLPIWVANSTIYENGGIFPFTPGTFELYRIRSYTHHLKKVKTLDGKPFSKTEIGEIPLSIGLKASASFPNAVPATTLGSSFDPKNGYLHLFDGGLSDNLGIITGLKILAEDKNPHKLLIVIDSYKGQFEPFSNQEGSPTMIEISKRTTGISLDVLRSRHHWTIKRISESMRKKGDKINVVYLNFDDLPEENMKKVKDIRTDFNISPKQQKELFKAAEILVARHAEELLRGSLNID